MKTLRLHGVQQKGGLPLRAWSLALSSTDLEGLGATKA